MGHKRRDIIDGKPDRVEQYMFGDLPQAQRGWTCGECGLGLAASLTKYQIKLAVTRHYKVVHPEADQAAKKNAGVAAMTVRGGAIAMRVLEGKKRGLLRGLQAEGTSHDFKLVPRYVRQRLQHTPVCRRCWRLVAPPVYNYLRNEDIRSTCAQQPEHEISKYEYKWW